LPPHCRRRAPAPALPPRSLPANPPAPGRS
jgi:hypothetical protein